MEKSLTTLSILFISFVFVAPMQVSAIPIPPEPGPTSLSCEPSPLEIYHGDSAYFTVTITDNDSDDQIKIQNPKVRVSNTGEIKNKSRFSAKERESDNPESGDRTFEVSFTGGPVHDLNGTTEDTVTFEAIYQEASTKEGSLFVRDIKQSASCLLIVTHSKKPTLTPSGGGFHPPEKSEDKNGQLRGGAGVKPGSFFYFFDTAFENIGLFFIFSPENKARKALEHADERLAEAEESAVENNPKAVEKAMTGYEEEISFATEKSKGLKDEKRAEELLNIVSENTAKHQEVLSSVLEKVPEEAKQAILNAIEVSKKGQEEAAKQIAELKGEIERLKKEVEDLKKESDDSQAGEVEKLKKEAEELKKKQQPVVAPTATTPVINNQEVIKAQVQAQIEATSKAKVEQDALVAKQKADEQMRIDLANAQLAKQIADQAELSRVQASQAKLEQLNAINKQIADLNAKYVVDFTEAGQRSGGTAGFAAGEQQMVTNKYNIDYATNGLTKNLSMAGIVTSREI